MDFLELSYACRNDIRNNNFKHALEFGVASGRSIKTIRKLLPTDIKVFGFDSFKGLPHDWVSKNGVCVQRQGTFAQKEIPDIDGVRLFIGLFSETIPKYKEIGEPITLLHIDCDLYDSTMEVLNGVSEFFRPGTIIVFDEWWYHDKKHKQYDDHEQDAFKKWTMSNAVQYEQVVPEGKQSNERFIVRIIKI